MAWAEKKIENSIRKYLESLDIIVEWQNWWKPLIKKWPMTYRMTLQSDWATDLYCVYKWHYIGIEVKKNAEEVEAWLKIRDRYEWRWNPLPIPKSWKKYWPQRTINQIENSYKIHRSWGTFILTYQLSEVEEFINNLK